MKGFVEKLKKRLEEQKGNEEAYYMQEDKRLVRHWNNCIDNTIEIINELVEEYNNGWIPCSERLPETIYDMLQCVIVTNENDWQGMAYYHPQKGWTFAECHNSDKKIDWTEIIAWQPLPAPYRSEKEEWKDKVMKHFTKVE